MLVLRSIATLLLLFALAFAVCVAALAAMGAPLWTAMLLATVVCCLQYFVAPYIIEWALNIRWLSLEHVDARQAAHLAAACRAHGVPMPRCGIIEDGNPNAFTFGHHPRNARIVITRGLLDVCDERELRAVIAHELGHIVHWDFVVMTVASVVPLLLYMIVQFRGGRARSAIGVGVGAYIAFWISEYLVLGLSRLREYYADEFSANVTGDANALATGLVRVAYGLAGAGSAQGNEDSLQQRASMAVAGGMRMHGVFDRRFGASIALVAAGGYSAADGHYTPEVVTNAMRWDVWNPWALVSELGSTHPLPAKRIRALGALALEQGQAPAFEVPAAAPRSYWDNFATDVVIHYLPFVAAIGLAAVGALVGAGSGAWSMVPAAAILGVGVGALIRVHFSHPLWSFRAHRVSELVQQIEISHIRCTPAVLRGRIIGRGIPGLYWSDDLVIQDGTGFMAMDYRQPLRSLEFLFGLFRAEAFIDQNVTVEGWYRRCPVPYLEIYKVYLPNGDVHTCRWRGVALLLAGLVTTIGLVLLLSALMSAAGAA